MDCDVRSSERVYKSNNFRQNGNEARVGICRRHDRHLPFRHRQNAFLGDIFIIDLSGVLLVDVLVIYRVRKAQQCANIRVHLADDPEYSLPRFCDNGIEIVWKRPMQAHTQSRS